jgi:CO/xanthine dehydrogenase FAD-binding subunit
VRIGANVRNSQLAWDPVIRDRRQRGSGCDAMLGFNRGHAVLGTSESCIAAHPSGMCVAMLVLDAVIHTVKADGTTRDPVRRVSSNSWRDARR